MTEDQERTEEIAVPLAELRHLFDISTVGSMSFGSGFLDTEEVDVLRRIAVRLGVDPMEGTPSNFRREYPHVLKPGSYNACDACAYGRATAVPQHIAEDEYAAYVRSLLDVPAALSGGTPEPTDG